MAQTASRTPIAAHLIHDPAQDAIDLPGGFFVRKDPEKYGGYLAERRST